MRYLVQCAFDGTAYSGWQRQDNALSIQERIEEALGIFCREEVSIVGCGRTDAGVHASDYFFHVDLDTAIGETNRFVYKVNQILPRDIVLYRIFEDVDIHARFDALSRRYTYFIHTSPSPFLGTYSWYLPVIHRYNLSLLDEVASLILQFEYFDSFCKTHTDVKTTKCAISESRWEKNDDRITYVIKADRFLRGMVRLIIGASLNVASGKMALSELEESLSTRSRPARNWSVPAHGLFLSQVTYDMNQAGTSLSS